MKKITAILLTIIAVSLAAAVLAQNTTQAPAGQKNECLLLSKSCKEEVDSLQQRIKKLNAEIKKGKRVYTPEELKRLQEKLKDVEDVLRDLERGGR